MQRLSNLATSIFDQAKSTGIVDTPEKDEQIMICFNALFHQCQITLHSMIVPVFSGKSTSDGIISRETIRKSAEKVVHHAHSYATLLSPYLYAKGDITHVPPLVGYGAFIAAMVLLTMEVSWQAISLQTACPRSHRENERLSTVEAILGLLDALRKFWRPLQYPYEKLSSGLQTARSTSQAHRGTAATESGASARHSMRRLGRRSSPTQIFSARPVPVEINSAAGGEEWDSSVHHSPAQTTRPLNGTRDHLANTSEGTGASEIATRPAAARDAHSNPDPSGADDGSVGSPFMAPFSDVEDAAWYSLSFAEAGIEQFAGFEPLSLFQQGWRSFS
ncbi:hypothetical protein BJX66DRAFT_168680 [Aspergillus keveii]|uniref:Fungal specific transcription factor n=1 Tax=Aspergillus keveii TaxID=714993 RepID=A0ABR4FI07_9EURO